MSSLNVKFGNVEFKNPIVMASGTFGFGREYSNFYDIEKLGGISGKGLTLNKKSGNNGNRIYETSSGVMNSVGLENPGIQGFIENELPNFKKLDTVKIVNLGGASIQEYVDGASILSKQDGIDMIELNISCPNVKDGAMAFGIDSETARQVIKKVRAVVNKPLIVKLSPNAKDIVKMAQVCQEENADGISLVNTFKAMAIDINKRANVFENTYAGLSGPAIKPIALRMVHEVCKNVTIPVMGMGGISNGGDAIEFIMAGASVIQIGTANFINPRIGIEIIDQIKDFMDSEGIKSLDEIRGII